MNWVEQFFVMGAGPAIAIPLVLALLMVISVWHERRRRCQGRCLKCGYNLTGNLSGVCPECGTPR